MEEFKKITHVIYDLDGLLLDTAPFYLQAAQTIVNRYGKVFDWSIKTKIDGRNAKDSAQIIVETFDLPLTPQAYLQERDVLLYKLFTRALPLPGAVALTKHFHQHRIPQIIATSSARRSFALKTRHMQDWFALFDSVICGDEPAVKHGKPAPDIFLLAAQSLGAEPEQCLVFEDSLAGMEAAQAAGMVVVVVPDPQVEKQVFVKAKQILNSLTDFEPQLWQLPAFTEK